MLTSQELPITDAIESPSISNIEEEMFYNDSTIVLANDSIILINYELSTHKRSSFATVLTKAGYGLFLAGGIVLCAGFIGGWMVSGLVVLTQSPYFAYEIISVFSGYILYRIGKRVELNCIINHNREKL
jgi:hypothetical protein